MGANLLEPKVLASLVLKAAMVANPESVLLVSAKNPEHLRQNAAVAGDRRLEEPAKRLYALAQREGAALRGSLAGAL